MTVDVWEQINAQGTRRFVCERAFDVLPRKWDYVVLGEYEYVVVAAVFRRASATQPEKIDLIVSLEAE